MRKAVLSGLIAAVASVAVVTANAQNVAYINAGGGSVSYLTGYGMTVTNLGDVSGTVTLGSLAGYDAVIITSNSIFADPNNLGNVAKQFADGGGGVVLTEFGFQGIWQVGGGIMGAGYSPFTVDPLSSGYGISEGLGTIYDPSSPLLTGVTTTNVHTQFQGNVGLQGTLVADWASGRHALGYNSLGSSSVVGLNLFPDSTYTSDVDTQHVVANAVVFSTTGHGTSVVPEPGSVAMLGGLLTAGLGVIARRRRA